MQFVDAPLMPGCGRSSRLSESFRQVVSGAEMGQLGNISGKEAVKAFEQAGWTVRGQVGSHLMMTKEGVRINLSIPQHKELSVGTLRKLIRVAGLTVDDFLKLL